MRKYMGLILLLCSVSGIGQTETLSDIMAYTYENSLAINANRAGLRATDEQVAQAKSGYRPMIVGEGSANRAKFKNTYDNAALAYKQKSYLNPTDMSLNFVQPVFSGFSTVNAVESARQAVQSGRADLMNTEQSILLDTAAVYMDVIRDEAVLKLQKNQEKVLKEHLASYEKRFKAGVLTKTDVSQAKARSAGATAARIAAEGQVQVSRAFFYSVVGLNPEQLKDVDDVTVPLPQSLEEAMEQALNENPKIKAALYATKAAESDVKAKKGTLLPQINIAGGVGRQKEQVSVKQSDYWQIGANLTVPLFQSGKEYADIRQARQLENKYRILWNKTVQDVRAEVTAAWESYTSVKAQISSIKKQIEASQIALNGVIREANVGSRTVLDVLDAEQEHLDNQVALVKAHRDEVVSAFALLSATGQMTPANLNLNVELYDPTAYYESVRNKWIGYNID